MKLRGLVLGTAAGALAVTGAHAADLLPVAPAPVDYVRVCDAFGTGFYFIPGTDTCLRVAGRVRVDYNYFDFGREAAGSYGPYGTSSRDTNATRFRSRVTFYADSRTNTEFGLLRTFWELQFNNDDGVTHTTVENGFIQFGGLTFGRTETFFAFLDAYYGSEEFFDIFQPDHKTNLAAYQFSFGNGISAAISIEDNNAQSRAGITTLGYNDLTARLYNPYAGVGYGGIRYPDIVGNVRVDQGWGSAQIMGVGHQVWTNNGVVGSDWGYAFGGGVNVHVPFGTATSVGVVAVYGHGATKYVSDTNLGYSPYYYQNINNLYNPTSPNLLAGDATVDYNGKLSLIDAWSVSGGFSTSFTPTITLGVNGGYFSTSSDNYALYNTVAKRAQNVDLNTDSYGVDAFLGYSPVKGMILGVGVQYVYTEPSVGDNYDALTTFFRAQRTF